LIAGNLANLKGWLVEAGVMDVFRGWTVTEGTYVLAVVFEVPGQIKLNGGKHHLN